MPTLTETDARTHWLRLEPALRQLLTWLDEVDARPATWTDLTGSGFLASLRPLLERAPRELDLLRAPTSLAASSVLYYRNAALHLAQQAALTEVLDALDVAGLPVIVFKGAYLIPLLYPTAGLRWAQDVDLLIPREQLPAAHQSLTRLGYVCEFPDAVLLAQARPGAYNYAEADYGHPGRPAVKLDLHWHWVSSGVFRAAARLDMAGVWARARPATVAGAPAWTMDPEDTLLHLCYHLTVHHSLGDLRGFLDIDQFVRRILPDLDWTALVSRATASGLKCAVYFALYFAVELLGPPVPREVLGALRPPRCHPSWVAARALTPRRWLKGRAPGRFAGPGYELLMGDTASDVLRALKALVLPEPAVLRARDGLPASDGAVGLYMARLGRIGRRLWG